MRAGLSFVVPIARAIGLGPRQYAQSLPEPDPPFRGVAGRTHDGS